MVYEVAFFFPRSTCYFTSYSRGTIETTLSRTISWLPNSDKS
ncbi:hypothetical protein NIES2104_17390 [Leptolyngbya sp. NIES-2104]|nr:hypothetical protein NIES2104_17390 [Leptolyngbya sp. NIES-2104]